MPVFSRLSLAWAGSVALACFICAFFWLISRGHDPNRIALNIDAIETLAQPPVIAANIRDNDEASNGDRISSIIRSAEGLTLGSAPSLRENGVTIIRPGAHGIETEDVIGPVAGVSAPYNSEDEHETIEFTPDDVVITIDGQPQGATPVRAASLRSPGALSAPIAAVSSALLTQTPLGTIPRIADDGRRSMDVYAQRFSGSLSQPKVSMIVAGLGLDEALTERAIKELPAHYSLAFAPYAENIEFWAEKARQDGHEIMIELPMDSGGDTTALGAAALLTRQTDEQNLTRLNWLLSRVPGFFAVTNYLGGKFSRDDDAMGAVLQRLDSLGIGYVDDTGALSSANGVAVVNRLIPPAYNEDGRAKLRAALGVLEQTAQKNGRALGKTYLQPATLEELTAWDARLAETDLENAPASYVLRANNSVR